MSFALTWQTAATVWRSMGLELIIFSVTLVFTLIIRTSTSRKAASKLGKGVESSSNSFGSSVHVDKVVAPACATKTAKEFTPGERGVYGERSQERPPGRRWGQNRDPAQVIAEVIQGMRDMPGTKSAHRALALYADLQSNVKELRINEAARRSNFSALEFYTTLVQCSLRSGRYHLVEGLLDDMAKQNVARPLALYESTMKQLAGQKHYHLALCMYDRLVSDGLQPSAVTCSCCVSFAAEIGELQRAIGFFEKLSSISTPSIRAYMTVLRVHAKRQDWPSSLNIFRSMQQRKVLLDSLVLNVILATGVAADQIEAVELLLSEAESFKPPISDVVSYNTLIKGYTQRDDALKAIQVIARMRERGLATNAITYNTAMDAAVRCMRTQEAWELLKDMRNSRLRPDKFTCSILVKGLTKNPQSEHVKASLDLLCVVDSACDATLKSTLYHSVLEAATQVPDTVMSMATFMQMQKYHVALTSNAYRVLVQALGQEGNPERCSQIWEQMLSDDIRPAASIFVALLESHLRQGQIDGALAAFESLRIRIQAESTSHHHRDNVALLEECRASFIRNLCRNSHEPQATHIYLQAKKDGVLATIDSGTVMMVVRVQADSGNLSHAMMSLEDMIGLGHKPNEATLHSFLNACIKQSHTIYAKTLLTQSNSNNIIFSQATYVLFLKLFGRCQQVQEAMSLFDAMIDKQGIDSLASETVVCLLRVFFQCRQSAKAFEVVEKLKANGKKEPLDGTIYSALITGCAEAGLFPKGISFVEDAAKCGATLPPHALDGLVQATQRRGQAGVHELEMLTKLAQEVNLAAPLRISQ